MKLLEKGFTPAAMLNDYLGTCKEEEVISTYSINAAEGYVLVDGIRFDTPEDLDKYLGTEE